MDVQLEFWTDLHLVQGKDPHLGKFYLGSRKDAHSGFKGIYHLGSQKDVSIWFWEGVFLGFCDGCLLGLSEGCKSSQKGFHSGSQKQKGFHSSSLDDSHLGSWRLPLGFLEESFLNPLTDVIQVLRWNFTQEIRIDSH